MSKATLNEYRHDRAPQELIEKLHGRIGLKRRSTNEFNRLLREKVRGNKNVLLSLSLCMGCGACLTVCLAYLATRNIKNSPLGRIALAKLLMRGHVDERIINEAYTYFWQCLTCRRCAWACPFGIDVGDVSRTTRSLLYEVGLAPNYVAGVINNLESTGNFLGLPEDVIREIILNVANEIRREKGVNVRVKIDEPAHALLLPSACADYTVAINTLKGYILLLNELGIDFTLSTRPLT